MGKLRKSPSHSFVGGKPRKIDKNLRYSRAGEIIKIIIEDHSGRKISQFSCSIMDSKSYNRILLIIKQKFGLSYKPEIPPEKSFSCKKI